MLKLKKSENILTAFAESASGPGWANQPVWVVIYNSLTGTYRVECIQPKEQTKEICLLYPFSQIAHLQMKAYCSRILKKDNK